ncbi:hypothetical protein [Ghiorsea bivora]|uniref:hypothetical protein n=1 Tax=Ghiorsea bivora TaxID=1485545 RepID=UPI0005710488|nr:hypothetical protein [Ghiorsea bivora]
MIKYIVGLLFLCMPILVQAAPEQVWQQSMQLAQKGQDRQAIALLEGAILQSEQSTVWTQRFDIAKRLLKLRRDAKVNSTYNTLIPNSRNQYDILMQDWLQQHPIPAVEDSIMPGLLAAIIPGAGHVWLGRWRDAGVAAMLVWPLLILTFWAARRDMGPVTVFFALITAWLWSGTVFSATSLAERGDFELYYAWWQEAWVASGLPSKPW